MEILDNYIHTVQNKKRISSEKLRNICIRVIDLERKAKSKFNYRKHAYNQGWVS